MCCIAYNACLEHTVLCNRLPKAWQNVLSKPLCQPHLAWLGHALLCFCYSWIKLVPIPEDLVVSHGGLEYLKLRPSHYKILQVICGQRAPKKNSSLSDSKALAALKKKRDAAWQEQVNPQGGQEGAENMGLSNPEGEKPRKKSQSCSPWAWSGPHWCEWQHCPNLVPSQQSQQIWSPSLAAPFPFGATLPMPYWWLQWQTRRWERSAHWSNRRQEVLCLEQAVCKYQSYMCLAAMQGQDDWPAPPMGHPLARWGAWYGIDVQLSFEARSNSYTHSLYPWPGWGCHVTWWMACLTALWAIGKSSLLLPCSSNTVCNVNLCRFKCQGKTVMNACWDSLAAIWCSAKKTLLVVWMAIFM